MNDVFTNLDEYKVGWWKKGNAYRYCYGVKWMPIPMVVYRTKRGHLSGSRKATAINPVCDKWFPKAEYLGRNLPGGSRMIITVKELLNLVGNGTAFWVRTANQGHAVYYSREEVFERFSHRDVFEIRCEDTDEIVIVLEEEE